MNRSLTTVAIAALFLTGCGGSDDTSKEADTSSETTTQAEKSAPKKEESPTKPEKSDVEKAEATATDVQKDLDVMFDSCDWQDNGSDATPITYSCESAELFIVSGDKSEVKVTTQSVADSLDLPVYATITDSYSVYAADKGKINQAWDVLGADPDATPHEVK